MTDVFRTLIVSHRLDNPETIAVTMRLFVEALSGGLMIDFRRPDLAEEMFAIVENAAGEAIEKAVVSAGEFVIKTPPIPSTIKH